MLDSFRLLVSKEVDVVRLFPLPPSAITTETRNRHFSSLLFSFSSLNNSSPKEKTQFQVMAYVGTQLKSANDSSSREKRQPWQSQMSEVDFQLSLLAKYAGIELHPQVLEIILDLIRMNVSIPMLAKMIKLMCAQKASSSPINNVNSEDGSQSVPSMDTCRNLVLTSSNQSSETTSKPNPNNNNNADLHTPNRVAVKARNLVNTRPTRSKTAPRVLKK